MDVQNLNLVFDVAGPFSNAGGLVFLEDFLRHTEIGQALANCGIGVRTAVNEEHDEEEHGAEGHYGEEHDEEEHYKEQHGKDMDDEVLSEKQDSVGVPRAPIGQKAMWPL